jgi:predicted dehydrogenase
MVDACERAGIVSQVGFLLRFSAVVERLKVLIDTGVAGFPGLFTARYFCNSLHAHWWRNKEKSGGQVFEQAIHLVDLMRYLLGEVETVYSLQRNLFHTEVLDYTNEDASGTVFGFRSGAIGVLTASNGAVPNIWEAEFRLVTKNLTAVVPDANHAEIIHTGPDITQETIATDRDLYALEMDDFINAVLHGGQTRTPMREGARTLEMVAAAARSAESHAEETI